jgi:hypothetical protein
VSEGSQPFVEVMHAALHGDDPALANAMFAALLDTVLYVQVAEHVDPGTLDADMSLQFAVMRGPGGELALPSFTDPAALRRWHADAEHVIGLEAPVLCERALEGQFDKLLVNHADTDWIQLDRKTLKKLAKGKVP